MLAKTAVVDVGGTDVRFWAAQFDTHDPSVPVTMLTDEPVVVPWGEHPSLLAVFKEAQPQLGDGFRFANCLGIVAGIAGLFDESTRTSFKPEYPGQQADVGEVERELVLPYRITVRNDFVGEVDAIATSAGEHATDVIVPANPMRGDNQIVLGPGTGLGTASLKPDGRIQRAEGGNGPAIAFQSDRFLDATPGLIRRTREMLDVEFMRLELLAAGPGLPVLHQHFYGGEVLTPPEVGAKIVNGDVPDVRDAIAELLALSAQTICMSHYPPGCVWFSGGVLKRNPNIIVGNDHFRTMFTAHDPYGKLFPKLPVKLVTDPYSGLRGNLRHALQQLRGGA